MKKKRFLAIFLVLTMLVSLMPMGFAEEVVEEEPPVEEELVVEEPEEVADRTADPEEPVVPEEEHTIEEETSQDELRELTKYTVNFYNKKADPEELVLFESHQVAGGATISKPEGVPVTGFEFVRWLDEDDNPVFTQDSPTVTISGNTNFYGSWGDAVTVQVKYNAIVAPEGESSTGIIRPESEQVLFGQSTVNIRPEPDFTTKGYVIEVKNR